MKTKVFIDGSEGTTGLRIHERLDNRDDIELLTIAPELRKDPAERSRLINSSDITFLCLPDSAAREAVALVTNPNVRIIDASTAHRTEAGWAYGFPELSAKHREAIRTGKRIANPGCHASGFISLVYPLIAGGILPADYPVASFSLTGYSGGGKKMIAQYEASDRDAELDAPREYGLSQQHKHLKEMRLITGLSRAPLFTPIVSDYYSGMVVNVPGKGGAGKHNGVNGDLQVIVRVEKDEQFERSDKDLYYNLVLDFSTAVLGGEVEVPTLEGKTTVKIEPGTQPGKQLRLRGKGMPAIKGYGYGKGDIIINITVYIPKTLNKEEKELVKKFKECENFKADNADKKSIFDSIKNLFK